MELILIILITIIPIALWGIYFYIKNPRKQPFKEIFKIFSLGMLSIVPVFIFHMYFLEPFTDFIAEFIHISEITVLVSLLQLWLMVVFIVFFMFLFAIIQSSVLRIFYHLPWRENFQGVYKKMYNLTPLLLFFLLFLIVETVFNFTIQVDFILSLAGSTIIFAVLEEYFKYIINPFLAYKKLNSIGSAIVNTLYIGLAFAFIENILFFLSLKGSPDFMVIYFYRSIFTTLLHVCASGILGYFYGLSIFSKAIVADYEIEKSQYDVLAPIRKLFKLQKKSIFQNVSITQGFFIAAFIHAVFNLMLFVNLKMISAVLIVVLTFFIVYLLNLKSTQVQYGLIGTTTMPEEDFENLRLKISVAQHLKEIQTAKAKTPNPNDQTNPNDQNSKLQIPNSK